MHLIIEIADLNKFSVRFFYFYLFKAVLLFEVEIEL